MIKEVFLQRVVVDLTAGTSEEQPGQECLHVVPFKTDNSIPMALEMTV